MSHLCHLNVLLSLANKKKNTQIKIPNGIYYQKEKKERFLFGKC